jgi:hypothetical protein
MILLIAIIQIRTSKNPSIGAMVLFPFETKIIRKVPIDTSQIRARKIRKGIIAKLNRSELKKELSIQVFFYKANIQIVLLYGGTKV